MTTTSFQIPTTVMQISVPNEITHVSSIDWQHLENVTSKDSYAVSKKPLYTISGFWMEKFLSNTSILYLTGFNFSDVQQVVAGIELRLHVLRSARIEDLVIQLTDGGLDLNGMPIMIGENLSSKINPVQSDMYTGDYTTPLNPVGDYNIYGGPDNLWGATLSSADIASPTFGVAISFKSNQIYPHNDLVYVNQVALRITYA
jgi:hypothetical protein